ncbi:MAG: hypothetical protein D6733_03700 [Methanobacteriota archaeon]|nr:MAG: hypothetical protein D6733_03700 [Euryarchaeota archaeon]
MPMFEKITVPRILAGRCRLCSPCPSIEACRSKALFRLDEDEPPVVEQAYCQGCGDCAGACPYSAITLKTVKAEVLRDGRA